MIKPLRFGEKNKLSIYKVKENERSTCFCICGRSFCFYETLFRCKRIQVLEN